MLAAVALAAAITGCGARGPSGAAVFAASCAGCHSLRGNERRHTPGGDLLNYRMSRRRMLTYVGEMPTRRPLSAAQIAAVSDYVLQAQARR